MNKNNVLSKLFHRYFVVALNRVVLYSNYWIDY